MPLNLSGRLNVSQGSFSISTNNAPPPLDFALNAPDATVIAAYRADEGITLSTGVSGWADRTANNRDLLQASSSNQPALISDGGLTFANQPIIRFNGTTHFLDTALFNQSQPLTGIAIARMTLVNTAIRVMFSSVTDSGTTNLWFGTDTNDVLRLQTNAAEISNGTTNLENMTFLYEAYFNDNSSFGRLNGAIETSGDVNTETLNGIRLGRHSSNSAPWGGDIAEVIVVDGELTAADRAYLHDYVLQRYNITTS